MVTKVRKWTTPSVVYKKSVQQASNPSHDRLLISCPPDCLRKHSDCFFLKFLRVIVFILRF